MNNKSLLPAPQHPPAEILETMDYELRVIPDCPNSASALNLYRHALAVENVNGDVRVVQLNSEE